MRNKAVSYFIKKQNKTVLYNFTRNCEIQVSFSIDFETLVAIATSATGVMLT